MRRITTCAALAGALLAGAAGPALAGTSPGNGAQKSALSPVSGTSSSCQNGDGSATDGWAILNKTGAPVPGTTTVQGEVHVVDSALAGQTVTAYVVPAGSTSCVSSLPATITLNSEGIGNGHVSGMEMNGSYFVAILQGGTEVLASQDVNLL